MTTSVIVAGARTPVGKLLGSLKDFSASDLGAIAIAGALEKAFPNNEAPASLVEYVIMGQVLTAGAGQMPARQAAVAAGIGWDVPALTINKMCLSGIDAIALADQLIRAGEFDVVVAGGQESMTKAPHLLMDSRAGYKYGDVTVLDHMAYDGLHDVFTDQPMGALTEQRNDVDKFTRQEQDEFAARSHQKAAAAWKDGVFTDEVVPVNIPQRKGDPLQFTEDEGIRANTTAESLAGLKPAFRRDGTITAGSASQISDGAAAVVVMNKAKAQELGFRGWSRSVRTALWPDRIRRCSRSRPTRSRKRSAVRASPLTSSTSWRSTRRSRRWRWPRPASWGSIPTSSTSTAARSRSVIRSACRAPESRCMWPWSWPAAAPVTALLPCVGPAVRATR